MSETEQPKGFSRDEIISALKELHGAWEGELPPELPPDVAEKMRKLRDEVQALLEKMLGEGK
jgi:hypothetical protein